MKRMFSFYLVVFFFSTICVDQIVGQEGRGQGRLTGKVLDEQGNPLEDVLITLSYDQYENKLTAKSNKKGQWGLIGLGKGTVTITAEKEGYFATPVKTEVSGVAKNPEVVIKMTKNNPALQKPSTSGTLAGSELEASLTEANELFNQRRYQEALEIYEGLIKKEPKLAMLRLNLGNCLMEMQNFQKAIEEYQKLLEGIFKLPSQEQDKKMISQVYAAIGEAEFRQNRLSEARNYFIKSMEIDPTDPALAYNVAEILINAGNVDEAINYYQKATEIKPDWPKAYLKLAYAWINKGNLKRGVELLKKFIAIAPVDDPDLPAAREVLKSLEKK